MFRQFQIILFIMILFGCAAGAFSGEKARSTDIQKVLNRTWQWVATVTPVERIEVSDPERYTIQLMKDGKARIRFDCAGGNLPHFYPFWGNSTHR